ncbi:transcription termination factor Rho [Fusobacterium animalis F0419]|uniref:Transcription termination factor Rho n=1 Tax=Fusobacterium animalis F0419 TaxID=999414 RepID=H1HIB6_9FUSO|nr:MULTISPECIES: transcription termination factor Rho [Fusobacterium]EEW95520.1 transcription termination factor Rho [Fusobacterium animalis 3_1_33]EHO75544.1 transcription termination factor Rho [Fusobacterium animalis F0419]MCG6844094.1 transcription termination factor Rho [Fusobacterium nucleatum]
MDILNKLLLKDLQEIAKVMEIETTAGQKKDDLKRLISHSLEENNTVLAYGILDTAPEGFGFLKETTLGKNIYMSASQIKRFKLRRGDQVLGEVRNPIGEEKNFAIKKVLRANNSNLATLESRVPFEDLIPTYPTQQFKLGLEQDNISGRILDLISPIGKGQRALIIAPPKAGKTTFISSIANALIKGQKDTEVWILLIDERPEEVTDIKENVEGATVFASTFDDDPKNHIKVTEEIIEKAKMKVEDGEHVVILLDSLTRLSRAYNIVIPSSGKLLSGGIDPMALYHPKNFFGAARNIKNGGSLTIIATILVDTGSKMDEVIYEEFKSTGNCDIYLDKQLAEFRVFPAIDITKSGTRKEELLLNKNQIDDIWNLRRLLNDYDNKVSATSALIKAIKTTRNNDELLAHLPKVLYK